MTITEKVAYLKGLMEGLDLDKTTKEGKILSAMADILEDIALTVADNCDQIDAIDEDLESLEEYVYEELDFDELAKMSDDFNAGDITEAVNEAAMTAAYNDVPISQKILVDVLKYKNPTYSTKTRIGFNKN